MKCYEEINQLLEKLEKGISICSLRSIEEFIECAKKKNLDARYFPVVNCGFIVYKDMTIYLTSEDRGTILSLNPMTA
jgi:hypothetical protein